MMLPSRDSSTKPKRGLGSRVIYGLAAATGLLPVIGIGHTVGSSMKTLADSTVDDVRHMTPDWRSVRADMKRTAAIDPSLLFRARAQVQGLTEARRVALMRRYTGVVWLSIAGAAGSLGVLWWNISGVPLLAVSLYALAVAGYRLDALREQRLIPFGQWIKETVVWSRNDG